MSSSDDIIPDAALGPPSGSSPGDDIIPPEALATDYGGTKSSMSAPSFMDRYREGQKIFDYANPGFAAAAGVGRSLLAAPLGAVGKAAGRIAENFDPSIDADKWGERAANIIPQVGPIAQMGERVANLPGQALGALTEGHPALQTGAEILGDASLLAGARAGFRGVSGELAASKARAAAIEEGHPLTEAANAERAEMEQHLGAAKKAGVDIPERDTTPAQQYVNQRARDDLQLPGNSPVTDGMIDAAKKQYVSPGFEAVKKIPDYQVGPKYQAAIKDVDLEKIDPEWRPPTEGTLSGPRSLELSQQLRSTARGLFQDAENMNLTFAERSAARSAAQAHYGAAKAVEGSVREAGQTAVADAWDKARVYNAKAETWRDAIDGAGNVSGPKIKKLLGDDPITGPMREVASVVAQAPEQFRSTRLQSPKPGIVRKTAAAVVPMGAAGLGALVGGPGGAIVGEHVGQVAARKMLGD